MGHRPPPPDPRLVSYAGGTPEPLKPTMPGYADGTDHLTELQRRTRRRASPILRRRRDAHAALLELIYWREHDLGMPITGQRERPRRGDLAIYPPSKPSDARRSVTPPPTRDTGKPVTR